MDKQFVNDLWLKYLQANPLRLLPRSIVEYRRDILAFGDWAIVNDLDFQSMTLNEITQWYNGLNVGVRMKNRKLSAVRTFFQFLITYKYGLTVNPCNGINRLKPHKRYPRILTPADLGTILAASTDYGPWLGILIKFLYYTGMRISETLSLEISNFDFERCQLRVIGKGDKERIVAFDQAVVELLKPYLPTLTGHFLFAEEKGKPVSLSRVEYLFKCLRQKTGLVIRPHILRHTFATNMARAGTSLTGIKALLGHEDIRTTEIYTHETENINEIYDKASARIPKI